MDITKFFSRKRPSNDADDEVPPPKSSAPTIPQQDELKGAEGQDSCHNQASNPSKAEKRQLYKSHLSYKKEWEKTYPWVYCNNPKDGMFCRVCQDFGRPSATARGAWTVKGMTDWNHATENLKQHNESKGHKEGALSARMAEQAANVGNVLDLQLAASAKQAEELRQRNRSILLKLLRSVYFLAKSRIPHTTTFEELVQLQIANGDDLLKQHVEQGASNAQYTSKFSSVSLIEAIDTWIERRLLSSLKTSPFFSILADECQDVSSQEELSICCRWVVEGHSEEHFITILHIRALDSETLAHAITTYMESHGLDFKKLIGQGYDGAAPFSGRNTGVQKRMRTLSGHALYIHCSCHRLQLASIQAAESVPQIQKFFGMLLNLWKLFYYSPKKAEKLKEVQSVLNHPELKVVKSSSTRWLSHERCVRAVRKELPAILITLQDLYETTGDAEAFGVQSILSSFAGVTTVIILCEILNLIATLNCFMQRKATDFSRLKVILDSILDQLKCLKREDADWCSEVESTVATLESEHEIAVHTSVGVSRRSSVSNTTLESFRNTVVIPYVDKLVENIQSRFSGEGVAVVVAMSIFNPVASPKADDPSFLTYGKEEIKQLAAFYGHEAEVKFQGEMFKFPPVVDGEVLTSEWPVFRRALLHEKQAFMSSKNLTKSPTFQQLYPAIQSSDAYGGIFPEMLKLMNIILALPVGTATVERSFSQMKMIKTRLRNRLNDSNLTRLMRIAIEGPELNSVNFAEILDIFKQKNRRISL